MTSMKELQLQWQYSSIHYYSALLSLSENSELLSLSDNLGLHSLSENLGLHSLSGNVGLHSLSGNIYLCGDIYLLCIKKLSFISMNRVCFGVKGK